MMHRLLALCVGLLAAGIGGCAMPDAPPAQANTVDPVVEPSSEAPPTVVEDDPFGDVAPVANTAPEGPDMDRLRSVVEDAILDAEDGDYDAARAQLVPLLDVPEAAAYAAYNLGVIAYLEKRPLDAVAFYERAMLADPTYAEPVIGAVRMRLRDGDLAGAQRLIDRQVAASDNAPQIRAATLLVHLAAGRYDQCIREGRSLLLEDEGNLDVFVALAQAQLALGRVELAEYILNEGIGRDPERPEFYFILGRIQLAEGNLPGARLQFEEVLERQPLHAEALNNVGVIRLASRDYAGAVDSLSMALEVAPSYAEAWVNLGNAQKGQQAYAEAERSFLEATRIDDSYDVPWFNLGVLFLDAEMEGYSRIERLERSLQHFAAFRARAGALDNTHPVNGYAAEAQSLLTIELELEAAANAPVEEAPADDWGDDGGSDDGWGDDGGSDDGWGDDGGSDDDWGDDGSSDDDWGDDGGSDDWGDDGSDDDWSDDGSDDDWGDDGGSDDDWDDPFAE